MIVNIRGTNGSGKSTVVRAVMAAALRCTPVFGILGSRDPEAYRCEFSGDNPSIWVLGPYINAAACGIDGVSIKLRGFEPVVALINKYAPKGHVLLEGALLSGYWGAPGEALLRASEGQRLILAHMTTPVEECLRRIQERRRVRGDMRALKIDRVLRRALEIAAVRKRIKREYPHIVILDLPAQGVASVILEMFREAG